MNQREVCEAFLRGESADAGPLWSKRLNANADAVLHSYGTPIAARVGGWLYVSRSTHTHTTAGHLAKVTTTALSSPLVAHITTGDGQLVEQLRRLGVAHLGLLG